MSDPDPSPSASKIIPSVAALTEEFERAWWNAVDEPALGPPLDNTAHVEREVHLDRFLTGVVAELRHVPGAPAERAALQQRLLGGIAHLGQAALGWSPAHVEVLFQRGLPQALTTFAQMA